MRLGDKGLAAEARFHGPKGIAVDGEGNVYIADPWLSRIRRVDAATGIINNFAGNGTDGYTGDNAPALAAELSSPNGLAFDKLGNLYLSDAGNHTVRKIAAGTGIITTVAGNGIAGIPLEGAQATASPLSFPQALAIDDDGNVYFTDLNSHRVHRVDVETGLMTTVSGGGNSTADGIAATNALTSSPAGLTLGSEGNLYLTHNNGHRLRRIAPNGIISTIAGDHQEGGFLGDGGPATKAWLNRPGHLAIDPTGNLHVVDAENKVIRRIDSQSGVITTIAGRLVGVPGMGPISRGHLQDPLAIQILSPELTLFAGGVSGTVQALHRNSESLRAVVGRYPQDLPTRDLARYRTKAFGSVEGVAYWAAQDKLFVSETGNDRLHIVSLHNDSDASGWTIETLGAGGAGFADGPLADALFRGPSDLYLDEVSQTLFVADTGNHIVRAIDLSNGIQDTAVRTIAGTPENLGGNNEESIASLEGHLNRPRAVTLCPNGDVFISDTANHRVRRIEAASTLMTRIIGGDAASSIDAAVASNALINAPLQLACDTQGNLLVTSTTTVRRLLADEHGVVDGSGSVETIFKSVPGCLSGLAVIDPDTIHVTDACSGKLVELRKQQSAALGL